MFRRLNPQAAPLSPLSSGECHRSLPRAWWRGAAPCHHRADPGEPSLRSCAGDSASWPSRIPKLGAAGSHGCVGGREVSPLRAGFLMTAELQCCVHETFLKSLGCFSAAIAVPATKDGTSLQAWRLTSAAWKLLQALRSMSVANPGFLLPRGVKAALPHVAEAAVKRSGCPVRLLQRHPAAPQAVCGPGCGADPKEVGVSSALALCGCPGGSRGR